MSYLSVGKRPAGEMTQTQRKFFVVCEVRFGPDGKLLPPEEQDPKPWKVYEDTQPPQLKGEFDNPTDAFDFAKELTINPEPE